MGIIGGNTIPTGDLYLAIDGANKKFASPSGCRGYVSSSGNVVSHQLVGNMGESSAQLVSKGTDIRFGNLTFKTITGISYPEGNYGGSGYTGTQGLRQGYKQHGGNVDYSFSRAFHMHAWNLETNAYVPSSYFNGERISGHCYDTYDNAPNDQAQLAVDDWNAIEANFPKKLIWIFAGSHANAQHKADMRDIIINCGAPSNFTFVSGTWCEFVCIGKSGSRAGDAIAFAHENGSPSGDNAGQFAYLYSSYLGHHSGADNYVQFNGTDDTIIITGGAPFTAAQPSFTISVWIYWTGGTGAHRRIISWGSGGGRFFFGFNYSSGKYDVGLGDQTITPGFTYGPTASTWEHIAVTNSGTTTSFYKNGALVGTGTHSNSTTIASEEVAIGQQYGSNDEFFQGRMGPFYLYNRALNGNEIRRLYNAHRSRYGV